ncbi:hypothetical protein ACFX15_012087 [Malus domestica]
MGWYVCEDPDETTLTYLYLELFSIELHHGGEISYEVYAGRKVTYMNNYDKDLMSLQVIDDMVEVVGYRERFMKYYY